MATYLGALAFALTASDKDFHPAIRRTIKSTDAMERSMARTQVQVRKMRGQILTLGGAYGLFAAGGAVASAIRTNAEFEKSMFKVQAVSQSTDREWEALSKRARELGASTKFTAKEAADGIAFLGQAGFSANENLEAIGATLSLAAAGGLELARAADIASNVVTGFNLDASETGRVADVLAFAAANANTNVEQMGQAMSYAGPIATALGVSLEEVAAIIGKLGDAGIQGERAGVGTRGILTALADPKGNAVSVLRRLGVEAYDLQGNLRPIADILADLERAGFDAADAVEAFEKRNAAAALVLVRTHKDLNGLTKELLASEGASDRMARTMQKGLLGAVVELQSKWDGLVITWQSGNSALEDTVDLLAKIVGYFDRLAQREQKLNQDALDAIREAGGERALVAIQHGYLESGFRLEIPEGQGYTAKEQREAVEERARLAKEEADAETASQEALTKKLKEILSERTQVWKGYYADLNRINTRQAPTGVTGALSGVAPIAGRRGPQTGTQALVGSAVASGSIFDTGAHDSIGQTLAGYHALQTGLANANIEASRFLMTTGQLPDAFDELPPRLRALKSAGEETFDGINHTIEQALLNTESWGEAAERVLRILGFRALRVFTTGGTLDDIFRGGRAAGGAVSAGMLYRVNEGQGNEYFRPNVGGTVIPMGGSNTGRDTTVVNQYIYGDGQDALVIANTAVGFMERRISGRDRRRDLYRRDGH